MKRAGLLLLLFIITTNSFAKKNTPFFMPESFSATFVKSFKRKLSDNIKKVKGTLDYKFPGLIRMEMSSPDDSIFVSNKKESWLYTPPFIPGEKGEVINQRSRRHLSRFFDSLRHGLKSNKIYTVDKKKDHYLFTFKKDTKKKLNLNVEKAQIFFKTDKGQTLLNIEQMVLIIEKEKITLKFNSIKANIKFKKDHFIFTPPPNTNISR